MIYLITTQRQIFQNLWTTIAFGDIEFCLNYFKNHETIAVDTETRGFDPHNDDILSLQLGDEKNQFVIDLSSVSISIFKELLQSKELILQNAKFDLRFLYKYNIIPTKVFDTYLAEMVLTTGVINHKRGLDALAHRYCNVNLDKTIRGEIHREGLSSRVIKYAAEDVAFLHEIKRKQEVKIQDADLRMALKLDNMFVRVLAYIEFCGIGFDQVKWKKKCEKDLEDLANAKNELDKWVIENKPHYIKSQLSLFDTNLQCDINWNSQKQVIPLLKELGINTEVVDKETGKTKDSIDASVLNLQNNVHPLIDIYIKYSKAHKLTSTFGLNYFKFVNRATGRIHTTYKQIMNTGRLSCGEQNKKTGETYPNLQQVPSDINHRSCFVSEKGNRIIACDYSGQEDIIFVNKCLDKNLLDFYDNKLGDGHSYVAKLCFPELKDVPLEDIKSKHKDLRQLAKAANFAIKFGGVGQTISNNLALSKEEGERIYNNYMKAFPGIASYFKKMATEALDKGYVEINHVTKRKSYVDFYPEYKRIKNIINEEGYWETYRIEKANNSSKFINELKPVVRDYFKYQGMIQRRSYNFPVQGSGADVTKLACCYMFDYIIENNLFNKVKVINVVHDEILLESSEEISEEISLKLQEFMIKSGAVFFKRVPLNAVPEIADYWIH